MPSGHGRKKKMQGLVRSRIFRRTDFSRREGWEDIMSKSAIVALIVFLLAVSFASAASIFTPASEDDFCFGYAVCE
jgi:hypothetical protein